MGKITFANHQYLWFIHDIQSNTLRCNNLTTNQQFLAKRGLKQMTIKMFRETCKCFLSNKLLFHFQLLNLNIT